MNRDAVISCLARGLWVGVALTLLRGAVLFAMESVAHGAEVDAALVRLARVLPAATLRMLGSALTLALLLRAAARAPALRAVLLFFSAAVFLALLAGWSGDDESRRVGLGTGRGQAVLGALALASIVFAALLARPGVPAARARALRLVLPALVAAALPLSLRALAPGHGERMPIRQVVGSLLADPSTWELRASPSGGAARVDVITPCGKYELDGADMPSIVLPPPGELRIRLADDLGQARLVARAGFDQSLLLRHEEALRGHSVRFEVQLDGRSLCDRTVAIARVDDLRGSEWLDLGGREGLELTPGGTLVLRTTLLDARGQETSFAEPLDVGFGGALLERRWIAERTRSSPERPNVVLVVMDTLRRDRLETYGYGRPTSPNLQRLARAGVTFDAAYSTSSWTWPSTASILTGLQAEEHGVVGATSCYLADELETLAEALQQEGFTTAAWSGNPLIVPDKNFDQGFEFYDHAKAVTRKSRVFMPAALEWLESMAGTRFFLYLHLVDPHAPLAAQPRARRELAAAVPEDFSPKAINDYIRPLRAGCGFTEEGEIDTDRCVPPEHQRFISDLYDACVWTGDYWLGRLLDELERLGLDDETLVVFTSDHGEELFDHGLVTHGHGLHEELVGVPLVLAGPGIPRGVRVAAPVSNRHLAPTLARLAAASDSAPAPGSAPVGLAALEGAVDLRATFAERATGEEVLLYSTTSGWWNGRHPQPLLGLRRGSLVLHFAPQGSAWGSDGDAPAVTRAQLALYDKREDPFEQRDLAGLRPSEAEALRAELVRRVQEAEARRRGADVRAGGSTVEMLRALGYIGDD